MFSKKYILPTLFTALAAIMGSCTKEDTSDCFSGLKLKFDYILHNNGGNKFGDEVNRVRVYLFDEQGILQLKALDDTRTLTYSYLQDGEVKTISTPNPIGALPDNYVMNLEVPPGRYKVVAWGGSTLAAESMFFDAHMNDPITHDYQEGVTLGVTKMEDFRMFMKYNYAPDLPEDVVPIVPEIDDLWYGAYGTRNETTSKYTMSDVMIRDGQYTEAGIELIKNTNVLKVTITGFENILAAGGTRGAAPLNTWVTAINGRYKIDNSIGENARSIRYTPHSERINANQMLVDIKMMRIDLDKHIAQPMYLTIENPATGKKYPEQPIDIVNTLMQAKDAVGNYIYSNQVDFDREYEHPIEIRIDINLTVRVFVRGWEIITVIPEV